MELPKFTQFVILFVAIFFSLGIKAQDETVNAIAMQSDGKILVGGLFTSINDIAKKGIARLNPNGSIDNSFASPLGSSGVNAIAIQPDGKILVGGIFNINGVNKTIARLNTDGSLDNTFNSTISPSLYLTSSILLLPSGKILLGSLIGVIQLNSNGSTDYIFPQSGALDMGFQSDGKIITGGMGASIGSVVMRFNTDGTINTFKMSQNFAISADGTTSIAIQPDNKIVVPLHYISLSYLYRFNADGSKDNTFMIGATGAVNKALLQPNGKILLGGKSISYGPNTLSDIARLNSDGSIDTSFKPASVSNGSVSNGYSVNTVCLQSDGKILVGGNFTAVNGVARNRIARLNSDGSLDMSFDSANSVTLLANGIVGSSYLFNLNTGTTPNKTYALASGNLPTGLYLEGTYAAIFGNPQVSGNYTFTLTATDSQGNQTTEQYSLLVSCPDMNITSAMPDAAIGSSYLVNLSSTGGSGSYLYSLTSGSLPPGLSLEGSYGAVYGSPSQTGVYNFTLTATDTKGCQTSKSYTITISCAGLAITSALPNASVGSSYLVNLTTTGGSGDYVYSLTSGSLPPGLSLEGTYAAVFGSPQQTGSYNFTITSTDKKGCQTSRAYTLTIAPSGGRLAQTSSLKGVQEESISQDLTIYPNPASDKIKIEAPKVRSVQIYDAMGRLVLEDKPSGRKYQALELEYDIRSLVSGSYFIKVFFDEQIKVLKFIKN
jgi:uncharacterized delta-60 repeat protein